VSTDIALEALAYFAEPHNPWQLGMNESANGPVREYLPTGSSMDNLVDEYFHVIEDKLNNRRDSRHRAKCFSPSSSVALRS
jgi:IS30 family transposase